VADKASDGGTPGECLLFAIRYLMTTPSPSKRWRIAPPVPEELLKFLQSLPAVQKSELLVQLLYNRGVIEAAHVERFLDPAPPLPNPLQTPKLKDLDRAVARLRQAVRRREPVAVYGDYDVDGVTATALLVETLQALGADVRPYIPDRVDEGYGLNTAALDKLGRAGARGRRGGLCQRDWPGCHHHRPSPAG
jgi:single-stranded-DNA-specific exonuclease